MLGYEWNKVCAVYTDFNNSTVEYFFGIWAAQMAQKSVLKWCYTTKVIVEHHSSGHLNQAIHFSQNGLFKCFY